MTRETQRKRLRAEVLAAMPKGQPIAAWEIAALIGGNGRSIAGMLTKLQSEGAVKHEPRDWRSGVWTRLVDLEQPQEPEAQQAKRYVDVPTNSIGGFSGLPVTSRIALPAYPTEWRSLAEIEGATR